MADINETKNTGSVNPFFPYYNKSEKKYVSIHYDGTLYEMGNIQGPIINPIWVELPKIKELINHNRIVYEHSISTPSTSKVLLTRDNYNDFNIFPENAEFIDPSIREDTYLLTLKDAVPEETMTAGYLYVQITGDA